jgi:hypothetical protein
VFIYQPADTTSADNGGTIIVDASGRRWYREGSSIYSTNVLWFGGRNATDYAPIVSGIFSAITAAASASGAPGATIFFPSQKYPMGSAVTFTYPTSGSPVEFSLTIQGGGMDATRLIWATNGGMTVNETDATHTFHGRDISWCGGLANVGNGITVHNVANTGNALQQDFTNCSFYGASGPGLGECWANAINIVGAGTFNYNNCIFYGNSAGVNNTGVSLQGNASGSFGFSLGHVFNECNFFLCNLCIYYGTLVQGVTTANCSTTNGGTFIYVPAGSTGQDVLSITNSDLASASSDLIVIAGGMSNIMLSNINFIIPNGKSGLYVASATQNITVVNNTFGAQTAGDGTGVTLTGSCIASVITGNSFNSLNTGVNLLAASNVTVGTNGYHACTTGVAPGTGNTVGVATP